MIPLVSNNLGAVADLCRVYRIVSLDVFGSAATGAFDPVSVRSIPELRVVVNIRNRLVHGYDTVDFGALWDIVQRYVPVLQRRLHTLLLAFPASSFGHVPEDVPD
jgi:uncharacterized protein with HEPN domain